MDPSVYLWLQAGHVIGVLLWIGSMFTVYWLLRLHTQASKEMSDKLTLLERSMGMVMDLGATLAIICGLVMAIGHGGTHPTTSLFAAPGAKWFHIKLTLVLLGVLSVHGVLRARIARFSRGQRPTVPTWLWTVLLLAMVAIVILVIRKPVIGG